MLTPGQLDGLEYSFSYSRSVEAKHRATPDKVWTALPSFPGLVLEGLATRGNCLPWETIRAVRSLVLALSIFFLVYAEGRLGLPRIL
jgi:hypothetical protein